jgi:predicted ferric reductase
MKEILKDQYSLRKKMVLMALVLTILPFVLFVSWPTGTGGEGVTLKEYTLFATSIFGLVGTVMMLWQFLLGTRVLIRHVFPDMVWSLKLHKWLGTYGSLFAWLHPLLGIYALSLSFWYIFIPDFSTRYETYITYGRIAFLLFIAIWVTSAIARGRIKYRPWKYIHLSSYVLLPLVFLHAVVSGIQLGQSSILLYYWYGLTGVYIALVAVRIGYQFGYGKHPYKLVNIKNNGDVALLQLRPQSGSVVPKPGQYVYMQFDSVFSESHPFTVTDYNPHTRIITLAIRKYGKFTKKVLEMDKRETVFVDGPYGVFTDELNRVIEDESIPVVMFAGGIGVTPYIQHAKTTDSDNTVLFNCNRDPQSALYADLLRKQLHDGYVDVYSRSNPSDVHSRENVEFGHINKEIVTKYLKQAPESYLYFICGHKQFMDTVRGILTELGVPKEQVRLEEFSF